MSDTNTTDRKTIKAVVRGAYDLQKLRIQTGLRIVANYKATRLGQEPGKPERELSAEAKMILRQLRASHKKITSGIATLPRASKFVGDELISTYSELCLVDQYSRLEDDENHAFARLEKILESIPIWSQHLKGVKGVGPAMAGVLISEVDISKSRYPSSLFRLAGLDVGDDGRGRSRRKEHLVDVKYLDKDGKVQTKKSITFNPFLKTKMTGVLSASFLRCGKNDNPYSKIYYDYRHRLDHHSEHKDKTKGHKHHMALRYMIKRFLADLHKAWREIEGLPAPNEYHEDKLGLHHLGIQPAQGAHQ